jgi:non-homologous end joining protein Ku
VSISVRDVPVTRDRGTHFRIIHKVCNTIIKYCRVCQLGEEALMADVAYGYRIDGNEHVVFDRQEVEAARTRSRWVIDLDAFVNFFEVDHHYVDETSY